MATDTLAKLRAAAQDEADKENDPHISTAQWNRRVNDGYRSLWNLVRAENDEFFVSKGTASIASVNTNVLSVTLGNNRLRSLRFVTGSTPDDYEPVRRGSLNQRPLDREYFIAGGLVYVYPAALSVGSYSIWTEPAFAELAADVDVIHPSLVEWAEYIYLYAALGGKDKEEADPNNLGARLARLEQEIIAITKDLDTGEADRVVDVAPRGYYREPSLPRP